MAEQLELPLLDGGQPLQMVRGSAYARAGRLQALAACHEPILLFPLPAARRRRAAMSTSLCLACPQTVLKHWPPWCRISVETVTRIWRHSAPIKRHPQQCKLWQQLANCGRQMVPLPR